MLSINACPLSSGKQPKEQTMSENKSFSLTDTLFAKGIALCLLLLHHLFYEKSYPFSAFLGRSVWVDAAAAAKVCVAVFLILSGYGLTKSFERKNASYARFTFNHIAKLYAGFWFVFFPVPHSPVF